MYIKSCICALTAIAVGLVLASCNSTFNAGVPPPAATQAPVVVQPLQFSKPQKIAWADVKAEPARPTVTKVAWDKLPVQPEDTSGYKSFKYPVQVAKFDYSALPGKPLDIDKLPSHPLKFKTYLLPPPKPVKGIKPEVKNGHLYFLGVGSEQTSSAVAVTRLLRDRDGFLWIACSEGIYRYDGENLLLFLTFPDERINFGMIQDSEGNIWLPNPSGPLSVLEPKAGILKQYAPNQGVDDLQHLMFDGHQRIWATCQTNEIKIIDTRTQTVKVLNNKSGLAAANRTAGLAEDRSGKIWISTGGGGIDIVNVADKQIKYFDQAHGLKSNRVNNIGFDRDGRLWIGMYSAWIQVVDENKQSVQTISEIRSAANDVLVTCISEGNNGRMWVGTTTGGAIAIDPEKRVFRRIDKSHGLPSNRVFDISRDNNGQVWMATELGLNMLADERAIRQQSGHSPVSNMMEDGHGLIWQAGYHGIDILDPKKHVSRHLGVKQGLANDTVFFVEQKYGKVFISTAASMEILDTVKKTITRFNSNYSNILFDKAGGIYFLNHAENGINLYDPKALTIKHFSSDVLKADKPAIYFLCLDTLDRIWFSNADGEVSIIDPTAGTIQTVTGIQREKKDTWVHFLPDSGGNIWMGTGRGIYIADIKNQKLVYFSMQQGLINNKVTSMVQHGPSVYAGTNQGITVITPPATGISATKNWHAISYALSKQYLNSYNADMITRDGTYWLGDLGASALSLSRNSIPESAPYIKAVSVYDHPLYFFNTTVFSPSSSDTLWQLSGDRLPTGTTPVNTSYAFRNGFRWDTVAEPGNMPVNLQIPYNQNFLHFHYGDLNLTPHDTTRYRYILNGFDKDWSDPTNDTTSVNYMNLPPGSYSFEVISTNPDNTWSRPATFSFTINPPWWKTWWAYILYAALIAGAIGSYVRYRSHQLIKEKRELENKVHQATEEIVQQKEEIAAQRDSLENQRNDLEKALSELKATQTQLIQSEKMASLGELTAGIAHEIQNPLNFVNNFSEVSVELIGELKEELQKGDIEEAAAIATDVEQNLEKIRHHGKRADGIVKGMLEHSRKSTGQKELTDINKLADEYLRLAYHGLRAKDKSFNAELITHFDDKLPQLSVVGQDVGRVLLNLFNNAFYATGQKAKTAGAGYKSAVEVTTSMADNQVIISVKDNGNGIPESIKDKIMQPFFTTKPTGEGTGLGLSLSYDIVVKGHGGNITVDTAEGEYSIFSIMLPLS